MAEEPRTWERRIEYCKRKHRPSLRRWDREGFASVRSGDVEALARCEEGGGIDRVHCSELSPEEFVQRYEARNLPVIIGGIPEAEAWRARHWTFEDLRRRFKDRRFKCGEDDDGYSLKVKLKYFLEYMRHNTDDSPLYVFDSHFDGDREAKRLLCDYKVPSYFPDDLFEYVGEKTRPPYRWVLIGPKRSGTCMHIDPLGTSAWNTVLVGRKRWVLMPPGTRKRLAKAKDFIRKGEDDEATNYFIDHLPRLKQAHPELQIIEFIQYPGETVFVPGGWWHAVLNLDDTLAVTQNFCSRTNFDGVWVKTRTGRKKMAVKWLELLKIHHPDLAARALELNARDNFQMMTMRELEERKREKKERKRLKKLRRQERREEERRRHKRKEGDARTEDDDRRDRDAAASKRHRSEDDYRKSNASPHSIADRRVESSREHA